MKKIKFFMLAVVVMLFSACHDKIWDSIEDLDSRVTKLEELCKEMNTNISALQTIVSVLQENDYISGIMPIEKGGEVIGYTIMFGKHDPITIYNGEDGKDGQNGSATAPIIGVAKDTDGVYYWTLNGEWLLDDEGNKLPVSGKNGNDGVDGEEGKDGQDGQNGTNGKDGVTPQLKIEEGYWYVSYDNGATWTEVGKAVGENGEKGDKGDKGDQGEKGEKGDKGDKGDAGNDGQNGDSMFTNVTFDDENVYFTLTNGTVLIVPRSNENGSIEGNNPSDIINFEDINVLSLLIDVGVDTNSDGYISYEEAANVESLNFRSNGTIKFFREFEYFINIKDFCFYGCSNLYSITLPNTIKSITAFNGTYGCFGRCEKLTKLQIPESCTKICDEAFYGCSSLQEITLPSKLKRIEEYTFYGCLSLKSLNIPNSVNYIGNNALCSLSIDTLTLPEEYSADAIGDLKNSNLTTIIWNSISYPSDYILKDGSSSSYGLGACFSQSYEKNTTISTIIFGEKVESLPKYLCYKMSSLKTIYSKNPIPPVIDNNTFVNCNKIENVYVPTESVEAYKTEWSQFADKIVGYNF